ncbi:hypothetical protein DYB32_010756 [Aphanomyces invadans]|uniref:Peptidase S1 domain-containing protein n=1 Tax=Aphanomyces invadans TaxID=157072 RepID=A0A3R6VNR6_9STRA|nr:hypothetical protein DYB32_010756 [Aphanomyces invadans]
MKVAFALCAVLVTAANQRAKEKHEYVSGLRYYTHGRHSCGGSLIAPNAILTAASCTELGYIYVSIGSPSLYGGVGGEIIRVQEEIIHPKYNPTTGMYNVAIMLLERPSKFKPAKVSFDFIGADTPTKIRGWGSNKLQLTYLWEFDDVTASHDQCAKWLPNDKVNESVACMGGKGGDRYCQHFPGYPLTVQ